MRGPVVGRAPSGREMVDEKLLIVKEMERKLLEDACEEAARDVHLAELAVLRLAFPGVDQDEPWLGAVLDELMGVLVKECPEDTFMAGNETLKRVVFGAN